MTFEELKENGHLKDASELVKRLSTLRTLPTLQEKREFLIKQGLLTNNKLTDDMLMESIQLNTLDKKMNERIVSYERNVYMNDYRQGSDGYSKDGETHYEYKQMLFSETQPLSLKFDRVSDKNVEKFDNTRPVIVLTLMDGETATKLLELTLDFDDNMVSIYSKHQKRLVNKKTSGASIGFKHFKQSITNIDYVSPLLYTDKFQLETTIVDYLREYGYNVMYRESVRKQKKRDTILEDYVQSNPVKPKNMTAVVRTLITENNIDYTQSSVSTRLSKMYLIQN